MLPKSAARHGRARSVAVVATALASLMAAGAAPALAAATPGSPQRASRPATLHAPRLGSLPRASAKPHRASPTATPLPAHGVVLPPKSTASPASNRAAVYTSRGWVSHGGDPAAAARKPLGIPRSDGGSGPLAPLPRFPS